MEYNENNDQESNLEPPVSDDAFEQDPVLAQYQTEQEQKRWLDELEAARKERKDFNRRAVKTIERYADKRDDGNKDASLYNLLFANVDTKLAALYARTPEPEIKRRFDDADDDVSRVAASLLRRNISYELEKGGFDTKFKNIVWDRLVPGIGVGWVRLEQDIGEPETVTQIDPLTGMSVTVAVPDSEIKNQLAEIDHVSWDDFLSAPCQVWTDCRWVARRIPMSRDAIKDRFADTIDASVIEELNFEKEDANSKTADVTASLRPKNNIQQTVDVYEVWDKETGLIFWIAESASVPLDVKADTNEFDGFFPTPLPPLGRFTTNSTIAISDYSLTQDLYRQLDELQQRQANMVKALQVKWIYDAGNPALKELFTTTAELEGVPVKDWAIQSGEKGGLNASLEFFDTSKIATAYQELLTAQEKIKQQIWEIEAIPDFVRGQTQQYDSAAATKQKGAFGTSRLGTYQRDVARYAESLIRLKAHLICRFYTPETIMGRAGIIPAPDRQYLPQAIELIKNDFLRCYRLVVSVDSIQLPNWNLERSDRTQVVQAVSAGIGQLMQAGQQNPAIVPFAMHLVKWAISGYKGSDEIEGWLDQGLAQMAQAQQQQMSQPKPPTPDELRAQQHRERVQADLQIAAMQEETKKMVASTEAQIAELKAQLKAQGDFIKAQLAQSRLALDASRAQADTQIDAAKVQIKAQETAHNAALDIVYGQNGKGI